jgi:hypothetical protein
MDFVGCWKLRLFPWSIPLYPFHKSQKVFKTLENCGMANCEIKSNFSHSWFWHILRDSSSLVGGASQVQIFFFFLVQWAIFDWPVTNKFWIFGDSHIIEVSNPNIEIYLSPKILPTYIGSKRRILGKACGTKWGAVGNMLLSTLGTWWTCLELI